MTKLNPDEVVGLVDRNCFRVKSVVSKIKNSYHSGQLEEYVLYNPND